MIPDIDNAFSEMAKGAQDEAFTHGYTVSNLYHEDDHKFIVKVLSEYLKKLFYEVRRCCKVIRKDNRAASFVI